MKKKLNKKTKIKYFFNLYYNNKFNKKKIKKNNNNIKGFYLRLHNIFHHSTKFFKRNTSFSTNINIFKILF